MTHDRKNPVRLGLRKPRIFKVFWVFGDVRRGGHPVNYVFICFAFAGGTTIDLSLNGGAGDQTKGAAQFSAIRDDQLHSLSDCGDCDVYGDRCPAFDLLGHIR